MRALSSSVLAVMGLYGLAASACEDAPMIGSIPDGATATEAELISVRNEVTAYMAKMEAYLVCLEDELKAKGDAAPAEYKEMMANRILSGDDERRSVVEAFNAARQAYRNAHPAN